MSAHESLDRERVILLRAYMRLSAEEAASPAGQTLLGKIHWNTHLHAASLRASFRAKIARIKKEREPITGA